MTNFFPCHSMPRVAVKIHESKSFFSWHFQIHLLTSTFSSISLDYERFESYGGIFSPSSRDIKTNGENCHSDGNFFSLHESKRHFTYTYFTFISHDGFVFSISMEYFFSSCSWGKNCNLILSSQQKRRENEFFS